MIAGPRLADVPGASAHAAALAMAAGVGFACGGAPGERPRRAARGRAPGLLPAAAARKRGAGVEAVGRRSTIAGGPRREGDPRGVRAARDRRAVPRRGRPAPRLPRRRRSPTARSSNVAPQGRAGRWCSASWSRTPTPSCRRPPAIERDGHLTTWEGRGQRSTRCGPRRGIALADWEIFARARARAIGGRPRVRDPRRAPRRARRRARAAADGRRPTRVRRGRAPPRATRGRDPVHLPAARRRGPHRRGARPS